MRIAVFAAGAVGGYFGGRLAEAGEDVRFIARGDHLRAMRERGLRVDSVAGDFLIDPVEAADDPSAIGTVDCVLVAVKAWDLPAASQEMRPLVGADTFLVPLLNGVEAPAILADVLGKEHVIGGLARLFSRIAAPGHIRHTGADPTIDLGELNATRTERVERLAQALGRCRGITVRVPDDINVALWEKFLFVASTGGIGAVTRAPMGVTRSVPETRALLEAAMREIESVARARGVPVAEDAVEGAMAFIDRLPESGMTSLQQDIADGRRSELEAWSGAAVRLGREVGVDCPVHAFVYASLLPLELRARGQLEFPQAR